MRKSISIKQYYQSQDEWEEYHHTLKLLPCPHCHYTGALILHGFLYGKPDHIEQNLITRGHRVFCSNKHRKKGCGGTYSVKLADFIGKFTLKAQSIWNFLKSILSGLNIFQAFRHIEFSYSISSIYRLYHRALLRQSFIRCRLAEINLPDYNSGIGSPFLQTLYDLQSAFPTDLCPISAFQYHFQESFL